MGGYRERAFKSDNEAATAIRRAVRDADGSEVLAAQILGISYRTLSRYVTKLGLRDELKALQKGRGGAPPSKKPGTKDAFGALAKAFRS